MQRGRGGGAGADARDANKPARTRLQRKGLFKNDLPDMMFAFGDSRGVATESVNVLEEILIDYISDVCIRAHKMSTNKGKLKLDDLRFALRNQPKQLARVEELYTRQLEIQQARKQFDVDDFETQAGRRFAEGVRGRGRGRGSRGRGRPRGSGRGPGRPPKNAGSPRGSD